MIAKITTPRIINYAPITPAPGPSINIGIPGACNEPLGAPANLGKIASLTNELMLTKPMGDIGGDCGCGCKERVDADTSAAISRQCGRTANDAACTGFGRCTIQVTFVYTDQAGVRRTRTVTVVGHEYGNTCVSPAALPFNSDNFYRKSLNT